MTGCAEANFSIKGEGPVFKDAELKCLDLMSIIEARMTKHGGLDFETNIEWLITQLVVTAIDTRIDLFKSLLEDHSLDSKKPVEEQFGVNIPLLRLIANGQIFNVNFVNPADDLEEVNKQNPQCQELLEKWIEENKSEELFTSKTPSHAQSEALWRCEVVYSSYGMSPNGIILWNLWIWTNPS